MLRRESDLHERCALAPGSRTVQSGLMPHDAQPTDWHNAVSFATFAFYEPANASERWGGGFSGDGSSIEVLGTVGGDEVLVRTSRSRRDWSDDFQLRAAFMELMWPFVMEDLVDVNLPYSVTFESDDRVLTVGGESHAFTGVHIKGDQRWVGMAELGGVIIKIATTSEEPLTLRICTDPAALPDHQAAPT